MRRRRPEGGPARASGSRCRRGRRPRHVPRRRPRRNWAEAARHSSRGTRGCGGRPGPCARRRAGARVALRRQSPPSGSRHDGARFPRRDRSGAPVRPVGRTGRTRRPGICRGRRRGCGSDGRRSARGRRRTPTRLRGRSSAGPIRTWTPPGIERPIERPATGYRELRSVGTDAQESCRDLRIPGRRSDRHARCASCSE